MAISLYEKIDSLQTEHDFVVAELLISIIPLSPFISSIASITQQIPTNLINEMLLAYIADGGTRPFKNILDPDSEESISSFSDDVVCKRIYYMSSDSDSESE